MPSSDIGGGDAPPSNFDSGPEQPQAMDQPGDNSQPQASDMDVPAPPET